MYINILTLNQPLLLSQVLSLYFYGLLLNIPHQLVAGGIKFLTCPSVGVFVSKSVSHVFLVSTTPLNLQSTEFPKTLLVIRTKCVDVHYFAWNFGSSVLRLFGYNILNVVMNSLYKHMISSILLNTAQNFLKLCRKLGHNV